MVAAAAAAAASCHIKSQISSKLLTEKCVFGGEYEERVSE